MIGTHIIFSNNILYNGNTSSLKKFDWHKIDTYTVEDKCVIYCSTHEDYPIFKWENNKFLFVVEGVIYNYSNEDVVRSVENISLNLQNKTALKDFVENADGEFIISIINKQDFSITIFNDILGQLPLFYAIESNKLVVGRDLFFVINNLKNINFSNEGIAEYLMQEYNIGKYTFFDEIFKLTPAEYISANLQEQTINVTVQNIVENNFDIKNKFENKEESLNEITKTYLNTLKTRVDKTLKTSKIINTLSGGFDSRAIFGGLNAISDNFDNITFDYIQDESDISKELLKVTQSKSRLLTFRSKYNYQITDHHLVRITSGLVNNFDTVVNFRDLMHIKKEICNNGNYFMFLGFGGEFIRHPFLFTSKNPIKFLTKMNLPIKISIFAQSTFSTPQKIKDFLYKTTSNYTEKSKDGVAKHLYNEYYTHAVCGAGKDKVRLFYWGISPLMAHSFITTIRNRIPLKWIGFYYFNKFIKNLDTRLQNVPIYKKNIDLRKKWGTIKLDIIQNLHYFIAYYFINLKRFYLQFKYRKVEKIPFQLIEEADGLVQNKRIINMDFVRSFYHKIPVSVQRRLLTIIMLIHEVEESKKK